MTQSAHTGPREWDAEVYNRVSDPQLAWGLEVLGRIDFSGDEVVLDAGCGTGRVTSALLERLPRGRVIAVDGSESMVEKARAALPDTVETYVADLSQLELDEPVDAIISTAVFHWIPDHDVLFGRLRAALRPGGRLVAQCGGHGNVANLVTAVRTVGERHPFAEHLQGWTEPWNFSTAEETTARLNRAGFEEVRCWLEPKRVVPEDFLPFLRTVTLGPHLARLPESLRDAYAHAVKAELREPLSLDYVRLNIDATASTP